MGIVNLYRRNTAGQLKNWTGKKIRPVEASLQAAAIERALSQMIANYLES
jgi:hypothetical protein